MQALPLLAVELQEQNKPKGPGPTSPHKKSVGKASPEHRSSLCQPRQECRAGSPAYSFSPYHSQSIIVDLSGSTENERRRSHQQLLLSGAGCVSGLHMGMTSSISSSSSTTSAPTMCLCTHTRGNPRACSAYCQLSGATQPALLTAAYCPFEQASASNSSPCRVHTDHARVDILAAQQRQLWLQPECTLQQRCAG